MPIRHADGFDFEWEQRILRVQPDLEFVLRHQPDTLAEWIPAIDAEGTRTAMLRVSRAGLSATEVYTLQTLEDRERIRHRLRKTLQELFLMHMAESRNRSERLIAQLMAIEQNLEDDDDAEPDSPVPALLAEGV